MLLPHCPHPPGPSSHVSSADTTNARTSGFAAAVRGSSSEYVGDRGCWYVCVRSR
uniref:GUN16 n=1 Tax=Arundo donax TaxID=35708 RepID=A0A0A9EZQ8_ARUDO